MLSLLYLVVTAQQYFETSSCMFLDLKTVRQILLNPWVKLKYLSRNRALIHLLHSYMKDLVLLLNISLQWNTSIRGTPPFRAHKIWSWKNVHITFIFVTSVEGTPLFRGKGFSGSGNLGLR